MKLAKSQRKSGSFFQGTNAINFNRILMPFGGQICLNRHFPSSDRTGVSDAPFQKDEPGVSGGASRWSDLGELVFLGTPVPRGSFCSVPARPRAGEKIGKV